MSPKRVFVFLCQIPDFCGFHTKLAPEKLSFVFCTKFRFLWVLNRPDLRRFFDFSTTLSVPKKSAKSLANREFGISNSISIAQLLWFLIEPQSAYGGKNATRSIRSLPLKICQLFAYALWRNTKHELRSDEKSK